MTKAYKCDMCGRYVELNAYRGEKPAGHVSFDRYFGYFVDGYDPREYDLCDDCSKVVNDFIEGKAVEFESHELAREVLEDESVSGYLNSTGDD